MIGLVEAYGCTYVDIGGYANLHHLSIGDGIPEFGVKINDGLYARIANSLDGNHFSVSFYVYDLHPDSVFYEVPFGVSDVKNEECVVTLAELHDNTTYYYVSFTSFNGVYVFSDVKNFITEKSYDWVDLGLSVKWDTCNVGASSPEEYGGYYAWGETEEKRGYDWNTYKWCHGASGFQTKYCTGSNYGTVDNNTVLAPEDDAARVKWGGNWRMPILNEVKELLSKCT